MFPLSNTIELIASRSWLFLADPEGFDDEYLALIIHDAFN